MEPDSRQTESKGTELLAFCVAGQDYAVDIMAVREIRSSTPATSLPRAPSYVRGVINLRGTVLPILDLALRLGIGELAAQTRNVTIVVEYDGRSFGLIVDAVLGIMNIPTSDLQQPPVLSAEDEPHFVRALAVTDSTMLRVLELGAVIPRPAEQAA